MERHLTRASELLDSLLDELELAHTIACHDPPGLDAILLDMIRHADGMADTLKRINRAMQPRG